MKARPSDLPDFRNPPVFESALSAQFHQIAALHAAHFGLYWSGIRERFPQTEERVELPAANEFSVEPVLPNMAFQFQAIEVPPLPRVWFVNERGTELIQLQRDRFIKNWRKSGEGTEYPRYESIRAGFDMEFASFREFAKRENLGDVQINQWEITYLNQIVAGPGWSNHAEMDKVFRVWNQPQTQFPGSAQDFGFHARFPITDEAGNFVGRLHADVKSVFRIPDSTPMFVFDLTARGKMSNSGDFLDVGRQWIVRSFAELTTPLMHEIWGRQS